MSARTGAAAQDGRRNLGLEVAGLSKRYGDVTALDGCSLTVRPGRVVGLLGPNGAGKTTTMRCIFGLVEPDAGEVRWSGAPIDREARLRFGYMPEERGLYPHMRVRAQLEYLARLSGLDRRAAADGVDRWLARLGSRSAGRRGWTRSRTATSSGCSSPRRWCTIRWRSCSTSRSRASIRSASRRCRT